MKKKALALVLAASMCVSLAACGSSSSSTTTATAASTEAASEAAEAVSEEASGEEVSEAASETSDGENVFNYAVYFEETNWDPAFFTQADDASLAPMIYENLVELQEDGSVEPQLATDWTVSPDGLTYTFNLRKGVQWHKGYGEFTSADVKFSIERLGDPDLGSANGSNINFDNIDSIETPDDYTVVFNLKSIDVDFITRLSFFSGMMVCKAHNDQDGTESLNTDPIGTGAFMFDNGTLEVKTEAVANPDWWGDREGGNIDRIVSTYISDSNVRDSAFDSGEIDSMAVSDYSKLDPYADAGCSVVAVRKPELVYVGVNMSLAPFDDPAVREAFFHAIDAQYYVDDLYYGREELGQGYIPTNTKYGLQTCEKAEYDPELSKQLLADAGYPNGCDITLWGSNDAFGESLGILGEYMLSEAGFNVTLQSVDFGAFLDQVRGGTAQAWTLANNTNVITDDTMSRYTSQYYPGNNWCGVIDSEYDDLVAKGQAATTEEEKKDYYAQAQERMMELQTIYPVCTYSTFLVYQPNVSNMKVYGDEAFRVTTIIKE